MERPTSAEQAGSAMTAEELLPRLDGVRPGSKGWIARCPAHEDRHASLSVCIGDEGRTLLKCFAGCENGAIVNALGLTMADLMPKRDGARVRGSARRASAEYTYRDEAGRVLFEVVRYDPKEFRQRRPDGNGGWFWRLDGTRRVLYRLPELLAAGPAKGVHRGR